MPTVTKTATARPRIAGPRKKYFHDRIALTNWVAANAQAMTATEGQCAGATLFELPGEDR
jgi:hypothetical protein